MPLFKPNFQNGLAVPGGVEIGFTDGDVINYLNVDNNDNKYVSAEKALENSDVYSVIYQLSSDLATSKLNANKKQSQAMIDNPTNNWSNSHAFWQSVFAQLLLGGEAFIYRWRNVNGNDMRWEYLRPSQVTIYALEDFSGVYYNASFDSPLVGYKEAIPANDMIHFRMMSQNGGATGISPLSALSNEFKIKDNSNKLTLNALTQSVLSPGILKMDMGLLNDKTRAAASRKFMQQINDSNGGPIVLDNLSDYSPLEVKNDVSKLLAQTDWTGTQIAKVYGVPDSVLNGQGDQQSSLNMIGGEYAKALMRFANSITSELSNKLGAKVSIDLKPALDPLNNDFASNIQLLSQYGTLSPEQAQWLLKNSGYLPEDMPEYVAPAEPPSAGGKEES
ncbi:Phage portal protein BeeE (BeeE) [Fructobacillus cardui]|uniref:phage portal protein n=1 Tax=Fructobacillus cardui TaxID=2893170 RepID=UPI002D958E4F|nr:Phage portal protein BeeE (BeeE) [Fructobacillus cardui]